MQKGEADIMMKRKFHELNTHFLFTMQRQDSLRVSGGLLSDLPETIAGQKSVHRPVSPAKQLQLNVK